MWPDEATTQGIVGAVGAGNQAADLPALRADLQTAFAFWFTANHSDADDRERRRDSALSIASKARELAALIGKDRFLDWHLSSPGQDFRGTLNALAVEANRAATIDLLPQLPGGKKQMFVAGLADVYRKHFGEPGRGSSGPFVRFVEAVLGAMSAYLKLPPNRAFQISGPTIQKALAGMDKNSLRSM